MILPDVNVLIYAHRPESPDHDEYRRWLDDLLNSGDPFALSELVLSGFVRIVTNPRVYNQPTPTDVAFAFADRLRSAPGVRLVQPGSRHWSLFRELCVISSAAGNLVPDAYLAALAIEHNLEWVTADRDYARFPGLRHRHPLR